MRIVLKSLFLLLLHITTIIFAQNNYERLQKLQRNKNETKAQLKSLKEHSALWGEKGYVGRNLKPLYTTQYTTHPCLTDLYNLCEIPLEIGRLVLAYPLAPVTIPLLTVLGIANCIAHVQEDAQKLKKCESKIEEIEQEIKKTYQRFSPFETRDMPNR